ncbi:MULTISPECIES: hypothetical protein [Streptomyces]|uniref:Uncharacterized protein n=1 Tax=Streptomyces chartreusis NRRL 3882 TaxID=1079985 RepID=A0A2N9B513_STRCX|nr:MULTISPECIES: hypothetical protein [Streptomyces]MYS90575.1 hypothetical protein [Streptomyces sp. SID5464]SOR78439.1 hypothetical protein SCNRRL3882_1907 [Streptomyces chartreusis NRRL 3882]
MTTPVREFDRFEELAGTQLYRRNVFVVTGLPTRASGPAVRRHRQKAEARLAVEDSWPGAPDLAPAGGYGKDEVRASFEGLQDPRRRMVDELLWLWGTPESGCDCDPDVHERHDAAVLLHARVLEAETGRSRLPVEQRASLWENAVSAWGHLLADGALRQHVRHRIRALGDPRLGEDAADDLLARLPRLLVSPFPQLFADQATATRLTSVCSVWAGFPPFDGLFSELFEGAVEEAYEKIHGDLLTVEREREARHYREAFLLLRDRVVPGFEDMAPLRPFVSGWRYDETAHIVAVGLNNLAVELLGISVHRPPSASRREEMLWLAEKAYEIGPDRDSDGLKENWETIYDHLTGTGRGPARARRRFPWFSFLLVLGVIGGSVSALIETYGWFPVVIIGLGGIGVLGYFVQIVVTLANGLSSVRRRK